MPDYLLLRGNALHLPLADNSVHVCVTSPPYFGLRDYGIVGQLGLERSIEEHVAKMVEVFREVRRVLRPDGVLWLNYGDAYATGKNGRSAADTKAAGNEDRTFLDKPFSTTSLGLRAKNLLGMPWRVAFALQADGWFLRADCIWAKRNPMPSSVKDRPAPSHEYIFLFSKRANYYYDWVAVREGAKYGRFDWKDGGCARYSNGTLGKKSQGHNAPLGDPSTGRNLRTVWDFSTQALSAKRFGVDTEHFAAFPERLVRPCVLAGPRDVCAKCGAPWARITKPSAEYQQHFGANNGADADRHGKGYRKHSPAVSAEYETEGWRPTCTCADACTCEAPEEYQGKLAETDRHFSGRRMLLNLRAARERTGDHDNPFPAPATVGWQATCKCGASDVRPALVLDPFCGSGTTGVVALRPCRSFIGVDLNPEYLKLAEARIQHSLAAPPKKPRKAKAPKPAAPDAVQLEIPLP